MAFISVPSRANEEEASPEGLAQYLGAHAKFKALDTEVHTCHGFGRQVLMVDAKAGAPSA